eukprot:TRINITY_DN4426_c0_g2_i1.p1 TRINITY_DN4426_c0_g2~~TRINITY_DN4426_c0_g2_i1.p1  ORF type:complete len:340 (+),score=60.09 TRINITY_DN4426_c0_g2_i1:248-1267(+)
MVKLSACVRSILFWLAVSLPVIFWLMGYFAAGLIPAETRPIIAVYALPATDRFLAGGLPHRWFRPFAVFDLFAAGPYMAHISIPIIFIIWMLLQRTSTPRMARFVWAFGWMNVLALSTQLALPTAPPWFYDLYTNDLYPQMPSYSQRGFPAGLLRVDDLLGTTIFRNAYSQSPVVYGAFPSMHCGWPFIVALHFTEHPQGAKWLWVHAYSILLAWAAMYLRHHYLTDVLGGWAYAYVTTQLAHWTFPSNQGGKFKKTPQLSPSASPGLSSGRPQHRHSHSADYGRTGFVGSSLMVSSLTLPDKAKQSDQDPERESLLTNERFLSASESTILHQKGDNNV